jgi:hypothetical protein
MDLYLISNVCWCNIPAKVWEYTVSGYAVVKKWLSYREKELLWQKPDRRYWQLLGTDDWIIIQ